MYPNTLQEKHGIVDLDTVNDIMIKTFDQDPT